MTVELRIVVSEELEDRLVAELAELGFHAFSREDGRLQAWGPSSSWSPGAREFLSDWLDTRASSSVVSVLEHPDENWNALWEASIEPVVAHPFVILPTWAQPAPEHAGLVALRIDPKMSFGTGHHASTRLALSLLAAAVRPGARVLDVGTGTGVLALGALKLGAGTAVGCDVDEWSVPNARECARLNDLESQFEVRLGDLDVVPERGFDLVLANIIRSVIVPMLPALAARTAAGGSIVLAGLLITERDQVLSTAYESGFSLRAERLEDDWWACTLGMA